jgi:hypothetical protein
MTDLIKSTQQLPVKPTAADTADWYRLGDSVEKHGRHMKRQAVAAEYNSGRNMEAWYREVSLTSDAGRQLLGEARKLELTDVSSGHSDAPQLSQALPTRHAALEYAKAEPEVREVIKEIIKEDPDREIKATEIRDLREENERLAKEAIEGRIAMNDRDKLREQINALTQDNSTKDLEAARKEADALLNTIHTLDRQIKNLTTKTFTHNDPHFLEQLGKKIEKLSADFNYKSSQIVADKFESPSDYSSGSSGSEIRVIDAVYTY